MLQLPQIMAARYVELPRRSIMLGWFYQGKGIICVLFEMGHAPHILAATIL